MVYCLNIVITPGLIVLLSTTVALKREVSATEMNQEIYDIVLVCVLSGVYHWAKLYDWFTDILLLKLT